MELHNILQMRQQMEKLQMKYLKNKSLSVVLHYWGANKAVKSPTHWPVNSLYIKTKPLFYRVSLPPGARLEGEALLISLSKRGEDKQGQSYDFDATGQTYGMQTNCSPHSKMRRIKKQIFNYVPNNKNTLSFLSCWRANKATHDMSNWKHTEIILTNTCSVRRKDSDKKKKKSQASEQGIKLLSKKCV